MKNSLKSTLLNSRHGVSHNTVLLKAEYSTMTNYLPAYRFRHNTHAHANSRSTPYRHGNDALLPCTRQWYKPGNSPRCHHAPDSPALRIYPYLPHLHEPHSL